MTRSIDPLFDQRIADWLESDPDLAPRDVLTVVESAVPSIPQRRSMRPPWRFPTMPFAARLVAVAVVGALVLAGVALLGGSGAAPAPSPTATATASAPASSAPDARASFRASLTTTFQSTLYPYTVQTDPTWATAPATVPVYDPASTDETASDLIHITGTDTTIGVTAEPLDQPTFEAFLDALHTSTIPNVPEGCDGGDPSTWDAVQVGDQEGRMMRLCNFEQAIVDVDGVVFHFTWANDTFESASHLDPSRFEEMLKTVTFVDGVPLPSRAPASPTP